MKKRERLACAKALTTMQDLLMDVLLYETFVWYKNAQRLYDTLYDFDCSSDEHLRILLKQSYEFLQNVPQHDIWSKSVIRDIVKVQKAFHGSWGRR